MLASKLQTLEQEQGLITRASICRTQPSLTSGIRICVIDVARQLPLATLNRLDISSHQFPVQEWLPESNSLDTFDIYSNVPRDLMGKYDVVHIRLLLCAVKDNDPRPLLNTVLKMLSKPSYLCVLSWKNSQIDGHRLDQMEAKLA